MDNENVMLDNDAPNQAEPQTTESNTGDLLLTIDALKEVIAENKKAMEMLKSELNETKKVNAKLLATYDTGNKMDTDTILLNSFGKYRRN